MAEDIWKPLLSIALPLLIYLLKKWRQARSTPTGFGMEWDEVLASEPSASRSEKKDKSKSPHRFPAMNKEEGRLATPIADTDPLPAEDDSAEFAIHTPEEARKAIVWGEILHRKY